MSGIQIKVKTEELVGKAGIVKDKVIVMQRQIDDAEQLLDRTASYWLGDAGDKKRKEFKDFEYLGWHMSQKGSALYWAAALALSVIVLLCAFWIGG